jgi:hypothetical protein
VKAISIRQPWAWLIIAGKKDIENRSWSTNHRGPLAIHAGLGRATRSLSEIQRYFAVRIPEDELQRGGLIGTIEVVDVVTKHKSKWFEGPFGWVLRDPQPVRFVPMSGKLGFFNVDDRKLRKV